MSRLGALARVRVLSAVSSGTRWSRPMVASSMYDAEPNVRRSRKKSLTSYSADTYTGAKIAEGIFDDKYNFLNVFLMERKRVHPEGQHYGTYINEIALYISESCSHKELICNWGENCRETQTTSNDHIMYAGPKQISRRTSATKPTNTRAICAERASGRTSYSPASFALYIPR